jgi:serine/threonine protein kinase
MRHATQSNGDAVVVKLLVRSQELEILRHLHSSKSPYPYNHIIPLHDTLKLNMGTFIVLPEATPLDLGFAFGEFCSNVLDFSRQLIEGVTYLHSRGIAHLDIKPQNIVACRNQNNGNLPKQLFIIDFDIAVRVDGIDTLIDSWCGTPEWMAPEIGHEDGPRCLYSPIWADLWSCGLMLLYLARQGTVKEKNPFETLTRQLLNKNPQRCHPLFVERDHSRHSSSELQGTLKRKADDLPHDVKRPALS